MKTLDEILVNAKAPDAEKLGVYRARMAQLGIMEYFFDGENSHEGFKPKNHYNRKGEVVGTRKFRLFSLSEQRGIGMTISHENLVYALVGAGAIEDVALFREAYDHLTGAVDEMWRKSRGLLGNDSDTTSNLRGARNLLSTPGDLSRMQLYQMSVERGREAMQRYARPVTKKADAKA